MQPRSNVRLIVYRFPAPVEGLSGPRQSPFESATGTSSRSNRCICNWPSINLTCTIISRNWSSLFHQYRPGCVGDVVVRGRGGDVLSCDVGVMLVRPGHSGAGVRDRPQSHVTIKIQHA